MTEEIIINGMNCAHCERTIKTFVGEIQGVKDMQVDLARKILKVEFEAPASLEQIKEAILDSGFEPSK